MLCQKLVTKSSGFELSELTSISLGPTILLADNQSAIALSGSDLISRRTKHIDIRYHFVRQKVEEKLIELEWTDTSTNVADGMTKPLGRVAFNKFRNEIGMRVIAN